MSDAARVVLAVIDGLRRPGVRAARASTHWVAPDHHGRVWASYRGQVSPIGAVIVGRSIEGGENPLSATAVFCKVMRVSHVFLQAMCDAYDGRPLWVDLLLEEDYAQGATAGLALRDILFPD